MSREAVWKQLGYIIGSARNPNYDKQKGMRNKRCEACKHYHSLGQTGCYIKQTKHDKELDTFSFYKCNCNHPQELEIN